MKVHTRFGGPTRHSLGAKTLTAGAIAAALLVSVACSSSSKKDTGASTPSGSSSSAGTSSGSAISAESAAELVKLSQPTTSYPAVAPLANATTVLKGKTVWVVSVAASLPFMTGVAGGITTAMTKLGASTHICDAKFLPTGVASCLDNAAQQGAAGVISLYNDYSLVPNSFDALVAKHIPVLIAGEAASGGKTDSPALAFYDTIKTQETAQRLVAASVIQDSKGKGKVLFVAEADSKQLAAMVSYTSSYYKQNCPGCSVNQIDFLQANMGKLPSQVTAALISHPDTNYVHVMLDPSAATVISAIQTAGKTNSLKVATEGGGLDSLQRVAAGKQMNDVGPNGGYTGFQYSDGLLRMMTGSIPVVTETPVRLFTKENVGSLDLTPAGYASNNWYGDNSYEQTFYKAWGLS